MRRFLVLGLVVAVLGATAAAVPSTCDVDYELTGSTKVRGSMRPAAQCASFVLSLPRGAAVTAKATGVGTYAPTPRMTLAADAGGAAVQSSPVPHGSKLSTTAAASGVQRLRVSGDGTAAGDYALTLTVKPRTRWNLAGTATAGVVNSAAFSAPGGASARVTLRAARRSAFVPNLVSIDGPDGFSAQIVGGGTSGLVKLGGAGEYVARFDGGAGGAWTARIDVVVAPGAATSIDLSGAGLAGDAYARVVAAARVIGTSGGSVVVSAPGAALDRTQLNVPSNAAPAPTLVSITSAKPFALAAGVRATGPFFHVGGPGDQFAGPITFVVPFDPDLFQSAPAEITVYCKDDAGNPVATVAKPYDFSAAASGLMAFSTPLTGTFVLGRSTPRALSGAWRLLRFSNDAQDGWIGSVTCTLSDAAAAPGHLGVTGVDGARATWTPSGTDTAGAASAQVVTTTSGALTVVDDATVTFADGAASRTLTFARGFGDDCLVSAGKGKSAVTGVDVPQLDFLLRAADPPTSGDVPGAYEFFLLTAGGAAASGGKVLLSTRQIAGTATFAANGRATFSTKGGRQALSDFPLDSNGWSQTAAAKIPTSTWSLVGGALHVGLPLGGVSSVDLRAVMGGTAYVGVVGATSGAGSEIGFLFLARPASGAATTQIDGTNPAAEVIVALRERVVNPQGYGIGIGPGTAVRAGASATITFLDSFSIEHDLNNGVAFGDTGSDPTRHTAFVLTPTGRYTDDGVGTGGGPVAGFLTTHDDLLFQTNAGDHFLWTVIELPATAPQ